MTYRTPENLIRSIMSGAQPLQESSTSDNMNPSLKTSDAERLSAAVNVLKSNGVDSAEVKDNSVSISAGDANKASDILDRALMHGVITVKPQLTSAEAIPVPTMHNPAMSEAKEDETEINQGEVDENGEVHLQPRSLNNRMQNQIKKIDENYDDSDIITLVNTATRPVTSGEIAAARGLTASAEFNDYVTNLAEAGHFQTAADGFFTKNSALVESDWSAHSNYGAADTPGGADRDEREDHKEVKRKHPVGSTRTFTNMKGEKLTGKVTGHPGGSGVTFDVGGVLHHATKHTIKESVEQIDEISTKLADSYLKKAVDDDSMLKKERIRGAVMLARKANKMDGIDSGPPHTRVKVALTREETELNELSYGKLKQYTKKGLEQIGNGDPMDARIARRKAGLESARKQKVAKVTKAAFGEGVQPVDTVLRILKEAGSLRLIGTHKSDCGKHEAKVYKDHDWNEHRVKFFIHGKHHEPADYHTDDKQDAHGTAQAELARLSKLNGALKEAVELGEDLAWLEEELDQLDEISKALAGQYIRTSSNTMRAHEDERAHATRDLADVRKGDNKGHADSNAAHKAAATKLTKATKGISKRWDGIVNASKKLDGSAKIVAKEEVADEGDLPFQPIEEISKATLGRYIEKAHGDGQAHYTAASGYRKMGLKKAEAGHNRVTRNRSKGIDQASSKVKGKSFVDDDGNYVLASKVNATEEVQINEISKECLTNYAVKATKSKAQHMASFTAKMARGNAVKGEPEVRAAHHDAAARSHRKLTNRHEGIKKAVAKLGEEVEQIDELVKVGTYNNKSGSTLTMHRHPEDKNHHFLVHSGKVVDYHKGSAKDFHKKLTKDGFSGALHEEVELAEGKKDDVEKSKKHLFKHPEADAIGKTIHAAAKHHNYVQDACDHVYSNHCKDVSYEDYDKMKPHLEATFKAHGLK